MNMMWLVYVIIGIIIFRILCRIGFIAELLAMIGMMLIFGIIAGGMSVLFGSTFSGGFHVGFMIGLVLYGIHCIIGVCSKKYNHRIFRR